MPHSNIISGESEDQIWKTISEQLHAIKDKLNYTAQFDSERHCVTIHIDTHDENDSGKGQTTTSFTTQLPEETPFRFRIVKQGIKHEIGKLFGMQDVIIGHPELDKKFLIQGNDEVKVKEILSNGDVQGALLQQPIIDFELRERKIGAHKDVVLSIDIEGGITEPNELKDVYQSFKATLNYLD